MILVLDLNPAIDRYAETDDIFYEEPVRLGEIIDRAGGKGVNVSRVLKQQGIAHTLFTLGASDPQQKFSLLLEQENLPAEVFPVRKEIRLNHTIRIRSNGRLLKLNAPGPGLDKNEAQGLLRILKEKTDEAQWILVSGSTAPGISIVDLAGVLAAASRRLPLLLDTQPDLTLAVMAQGSLHSLLPNRPEAASLAGCALDTPEALELWMTAIHPGVRYPIVTDGAKGAWYLDETGRLAHARPPRIESGLTVGAGDAFAAGWLAAMYRGSSVQDSLELALLLGAEACTRQGS